MYAEYIDGHRKMQLVSSEDALALDTNERREPYRFRLLTRFSGRDRASAFFASLGWNYWDYIVVYGMIAIYRTCNGKGNQQFGVPGFTIDLEPQGGNVEVRISKGGGGEVKAVFSKGELTHWTIAATQEMTRVAEFIYFGTLTAKPSDGDHLFKVAGELDDKIGRRGD
jgi:hypothetical protein